MSSSIPSLDFSFGIIIQVCESSKRSLFRACASLNPLSAGDGNPSCSYKLRGNVVEIYVGKQGVMLPFFVLIASATKTDINNVLGTVSASANSLNDVTLVYNGFLIRTSQSTCISRRQLCSAPRKSGYIIT